jgi:prepilin-type N-terminal cleavage/methylation domain-containing protein
VVAVGSQLSRGRLPDALSSAEFMSISFQERKPSPGANYENTPSAFSLTELLVVIAVVAILAALILTAIVGTRKRVQQAQCAHNVGQLGVGLQLFVTDYHVYPLQVNTAYRQGTYPEHQTAWISALEGILSRTDPVKQPGLTNVYQKGIWVCPSAPRPSSFPDTRGYNSYGYNAYGLSTQAAGINPVVRVCVCDAENADFFLISKHRRATE